MNEKLSVEISADIKSLKKELEKAGLELKKFNNTTAQASTDSVKNLNNISTAAKNLGGILAGAFAVSNILSFGKSVVNTTAEFQKLEAVLSNTLGSSSAAQLAMQSIVDFASKTPFSVNELTDSFVKLANQGFTPTVNEMRSLGDLASSTGKSFNQLAEAILDAQTGEFERLKEFGIRASAEGDKVKFTFKGVTTEVQKTSEAMRGYILSLGNAEGVTGAMDKISKTLGGQLSNLGDNWTTLMKNIGDANDGILSKTVTILNDILSAWNKIGQADNITLKLGIDQRGQDLIDKLPFAEFFQNLTGGVTYGQSANLMLADTYNKIGKQISDAKTVKELENLKTVLRNTRNELEFGSPQWTIYNQRLIDASNALIQLKKNKKSSVVTTPTERPFEEPMALKKSSVVTTPTERPFEEPMALMSGASELKKEAKELFDLYKENPETLKTMGNVYASNPFFRDLINGDISQQTQKLTEDLKGLKQTKDTFGDNTIKLVSPEQLANIENMVQLLGGALTSAFDAALINGQNFAQVLMKAIGDLIKRLIAAVATAAILSAALSIFSGGSFTFLSAFQKFLPQLTGFNIGGKSDKIVSPVPTTNSGSVSFEIRGDKLYGVLQNYQGRLSRLS